MIKIIGIIVVFGCVLAGFVLSGGKIASIIHPDREQDEQLKVEKTVMLQHANQAYEQQDLFYLLKLQIQVEQNRGVTQKGLSNEQAKF